MQNFGEIFSDLMKDKGDSPVRLAEAFSVNPATVYSWKNNEYSPALSKLILKYLLNI